MPGRCAADTRRPVDATVIPPASSAASTAVPAVLAALEAGGMTVASVTVSRPSLDDVYLRHTGRAYADADAEGEASA